MKRVMGFLLILFGILIFGHVIWESDIGGWFTNRSVIQKSIFMTNINLIQINATRADISIVPTNNQHLKAVLTGRDTANVHLTVNRDFNKALVNVDQKWYTFSFTPYRLKLTVYVPRQLRSSLQVSLTSGNLQIGELQKPSWVLDNLSTNLDSGNSTLQNINVNQWKHQATSGNMTANRVIAKKTIINGTSGNVKLIHPAGDIDLFLTSGNFVAQYDQLNSNLKLVITSGNVTLKVPKKSSFTLTSLQEFGDVQSYLPLQWQKQTNNRKIATYGSGKYQIYADLLSGNLIIN